MSNSEKSMAAALAGLLFAVKHNDGTAGAAERLANAQCIAKGALEALVSG